MTKKYSSNKYNSNNNFNNSRHNSVSVKTTANAATLVETVAAGVDSNSYQQDQICSQANANLLTKPE